MLEMHSLYSADAQMLLHLDDDLLEKTHAAHDALPFAAKLFKYIENSQVCSVFTHRVVRCFGWAGCCCLFSLFPMVCVDV